jgi:hypothetical protein
MKTDIASILAKYCKNSSKLAQLYPYIVYYITNSRPNNYYLYICNNNYYLCNNNRVIAKCTSNILYRSNLNLVIQNKLTIDIFSKDISIMYLGKNIINIKRQYHGRVDGLYWPSSKKYSFIGIAKINLVNNLIIN